MRWLSRVPALVLAATFTVVAQQAPPPRPGTVTPGPAAPLPFPGDAPAVGTAGISGKVVQLDTGTPLAGAQVMLSGTTVRMASSGDDGRFEFADLPAGRYFLRASLGGYVDPSSSGILDIGSQLEVADGQLLDDIDLALARGGVVVGRVIDEFGDPVTGAEIRVETAGWGPDGRYLETVSLGLGQSSLFLSTNDLGEFRVYGLAPGDYFVSARMRGFGAPLTPGPGGDERTEGFLPTYFPGTSEVAEAQAVRIRAGGETATDFAMVPGRMGRISGTVVTVSGRSPSGLHVYLRVQTSTSSGQIDGGAVGADGAFDVGNVPPGTYTLIVREPGGGGGPDTETAALPITVARRDISGLRLTARAGARIAGRVEWEGTSPQPDRPIQIRTRPAEWSPGPMGMIGAGTSTYLNPGNGTVDENDTFEMDGITGTVLVRPGVPAPWALKAVIVEGRDITDVGVEAHSLGGDRVIRVVLTDRMPEITGSVRSARGQPVANSIAVILPQQPITGIGATRFTQTARTDQRGTFRLQSLPPGRYVAAAVEQLDENEHWNPELQEAVRRTGERFTLDEGQHLTLDLELLP